MATAIAPSIDWASEIDRLGPQLVAEIEAYLKQQAPQSAPRPAILLPEPTPQPAIPTSTPRRGQHPYQWNAGYEHPTPTLLQRLRGLQPRTPVTTGQYLQLMDRYIRQHGWTQGLLWDTAGRVCILGARARVLAAGYGTPAVDEHARHLLGNETRMPIADWNDTEGRQVCDIHALLQATARRVT